MPFLGGFRLQFRVETLVHSTYFRNQTPSLWNIPFAHRPVMIHDKEISTVLSPSPGNLDTFRCGCDSTDPSVANHLQDQLFHRLRPQFRPGIIGSSPAVCMAGNRRCPGIEILAYTASTSAPSTVITSHHSSASSPDLPPSSSVWAAWTSPHHSAISHSARTGADSRNRRCLDPVAANIFPAASVE